MKRLLVPFLKFGALSGIGWICDFLLLLCLVRFLSIPPLYANFVSSSCAALLVFFISRQLVFMAASGRLGARAGFYVLYTLGVILIASFALEFLAGVLHNFASTRGSRPPDVFIAGVAKILITPPQLCLNFLVARFLIERRAVLKAHPDA